MPTRKDPPLARPASGSGAPLLHRPVGEARELDELLEGSYPSFGGGFLRRVWKLLDEAIGAGLPMTLAISGPVTASGTTSGTFFFGAADAACQNPACA